LIENGAPEDEPKLNEFMDDVVDGVFSLPSFDLKLNPIDGFEIEVFVPTLSELNPKVKLAGEVFACGAFGVIDPIAGWLRLKEKGFFESKFPADPVRELGSPRIALPNKDFSFEPSLVLFVLWGTELPSTVPPKVLF